MVLRTDRHTRKTTNSVSVNYKVVVCSAMCDGIEDSISIFHEDHFGWSITSTLTFNVPTLQPQLSLNKKFLHSFWQKQNSRTEEDEKSLKPLIAREMAN